MPMPLEMSVIDSFSETDDKQQLWRCFMSHKIVVTTSGATNSTASSGSTYTASSGSTSTASTSTAITSASTVTSSASIPTTFATVAGSNTSINSTTFSTLSAKVLKSPPQLEVINPVQRNGIFLSRLARYVGERHS